MEYARFIIDDPCAYCGRSDVKRQIEHIVPIFAGGQTTVENLTTACGSCNQRKADKSLLEFMAEITQPLKRHTIYMREWNVRNRERVNAQRRVRLAKAKAASAAN